MICVGLVVGDFCFVIDRFIDFFFFGEGIVGKDFCLFFGEFLLVMFWVCILLVFEFDLLVWVLFSFFKKSWDGIYI